MRITEIGVSQREVFEKCPVFWYHAYLLGDRSWGLVPSADPIPTLWGSIGHEGLRTWYEHLRVGTPPLEAVDPAIEAMCAYRTKRLNAAIERGLPVTPPDDDPRNDVRLAHSFMNGYARFYMDDSLREYLSVEREFSIEASAFYPAEILGTVCKHMGLSPSDLPAVRGTIDLIYRNSDGALGVMDHKFNTNVDTDLDWGMPHWKQPLLYTRAASLLFNEDCMEYTHNQIRKPVGLKPRLNDGTLESAADFTERLAREYLNFPDYRQEYPNRKKGYFCRAQFPDPPHSEGRWLYELCFQDAMALKLAQTLPDGPLPFVEPPPWFPRRDSRNGCRHYNKPCVYASLCDFGYSPATRSLYVERDEPHP